MYNVKMFVFGLIFWTVAIIVLGFATTVFAQTPAPTPKCTLGNGAPVSARLPMLVDLEKSSPQKIKNMIATGVFGYMAEGVTKPVIPIKYSFSGNFVSVQFIETGAIFWTTDEGLVCE